MPLGTENVNTHMQQTEGKALKNNEYTVEVRLSGTRLTGKFDQPDLIEKKNHT